jgi:uncharacterized membrane protein YcfT
MNTDTRPTRIDWVDYAKGICIILVVMMHSTLGVEKSMGEQGWLSLFIAWAKPFRMPDFFLISGLFLAKRIAAPWPRYADTKIMHFAYFYLLWMTIQFLFKGPGIYHDQGASGLLREYLLGFIEPFGTLWFIYLLAVFFAVTKLLAKLPPLLVFAVATLLETTHIHTGWTLIDESASRYVYFFAGYWLASSIFAYAGWLSRKPTAGLVAGLALWATVEAIAVFNGYSEQPGISLVLGLVGASAVVAFGVLASSARAVGFLRYLGANSIVVYLAFFLFMAASRSILIKFAPWLGVDPIAMLVTAVGIVGPVLLYQAVRNTPARLLFERPRWARVESWRKGWHSTAHESFQKHSQPQTR